MLFHFPLLDINGLAHCSEPCSFIFVDLGDLKNENVAMWKKFEND